MTPRRLLTGLLALGVLAAPTAVGTATAEPKPDLVAEVTARLHEAAPRIAAATPRVGVTRQDAGWAFGTAVLAAPPNSDTMPQGWLFVARLGDAGWQVALEGEPAFGTLSAKSPLVGDAERDVLAAQNGLQTQANGDWRTGLALPYAVGQTWAMPGGPHGWSGAAAPYSSIDLAGGDQVVRAARAGAAYTICKGWVRVVHDRGYATDYYHLWDNINVDGAAVGQGAYLGYTGTDVTCGGSASGRHVHFALRQNNVYVGIADHNVGKWVPQNGASAYQGFALHGSTRANAGGSLYNYGALGFTQGVMDTNGGGVVNKRTGPGTNYALAGTVADGATVTVSCSRNGTSHSGRWGTTSLWNRLSDGTWVTDAFMWTGLNGPVNGTC
ncbi:peptidoglycan DD-metalloendopeptidase family protein [Actinophytocola sediminis]